MSQTVSTYVHMPYELREKLEFIGRNFLHEEARRQSLLISGQSDPSDDIWEDNIDDSDWRS